MKKIRVILADDHKVFLEGLEAILKDHPDIEIVGTAHHGHTVLALLRTTIVDVVLLDISMPELDGIETTKIILRDFPDVKILILSMHSDPTYVRNLRDLGVHGYLLKEADRTELEEAIKTLDKGREFFSIKVTQIARSSPKTLGQETDIKFTKRETEVMNGLAEGWENQKIADAMHVEMSTVETHLKSIRAKTGLGSARALVRWAIDHGFGMKVTGG